MSSFITVIKGYLMKLLRTLFYYMVFIIAIIFTLIPCFFLSLLPAKVRYDNRLYYFFMGLFYRLCLKGTLLPITFIGKENMPKGAAIFVANHQSALDVLLIGVVLRCKPHLWFFKNELTKIPLYGLMAKRMNIVVDRSSPRKAFSSVIEAIKLTKDVNRSVIIFPEGGRFSDGKVHDFLWGFAIIARKTGHPVVPILIVDAYKVYPAGSFFLRYNPIQVVIGKPFIIEAEESDEAFVKRVHSWFIEQSKV
jgi:1-acyl-sn-glycerol-3-phosphate acyltransferase